MHHCRRVLAGAVLPPRRSANTTPFAAPSVRTDSANEGLPEWTMTGADCVASATRRVRGTVEPHPHSMVFGRALPGRVG
jgi:hypothetical protein